MGFESHIICIFSLPVAVRYGTVNKTDRINWFVNKTALSDHLQEL